MKIAAIIAKYSKPALSMAVDAVHKGDNFSLEQGLVYERDLFYSLFDTDDQKEGMFKNPEAISLAPICNGINKLLNVPLKPAVNTKNTIIVP